MKVENERNKWKAKSEFKNGRNEIQDFQYLAVCIVENTVTLVFGEIGTAIPDVGTLANRGG